MSNDKLPDRISNDLPDLGPLEPSQSFKGRSTALIDERGVTIMGVTLSQREICRRTGIHASHLSRIVHGQRAPGLNVVMRLAKAFGPHVTIDDVVRCMSSIRRQKPYVNPRDKRESE